MAKDQGFPTSFCHLALIFFFVERGRICELYTTYGSPTYKQATWQNKTHVRTTGQYTSSKRYALPPATSYTFLIAYMQVTFIEYLTFRASYLKYTV
jgi:hypothetical protein